MKRITVQYPQDLTMTDDEAQLDALVAQLKELDQDDGYSLFYSGVPATLDDIAKMGLAARHLIAQDLDDITPNSLMPLVDCVSLNMHNVYLTAHLKPSMLGQTTITIIYSCTPLGWSVNLAVVYPDGKIFETSQAFISSY